MRYAAVVYTKMIFCFAVADTAMSRDENVTALICQKMNGWLADGITSTFSTTLPHIVSVRPLNQIASSGYAK